MGYIQIAQMLDIKAYKLKPDSFTSNNIISMYGKLTLATVEQYNIHCRMLVDTLVDGLNAELLTSREITDHVYGKEYHNSHGYHSIIKNNMLYLDYEFLTSRTYDNLAQVRQLLIDKRDKINNILGKE